MPKNYNLNNNYNQISMRTDSVVELIKELSKLGVFKGKRKAKAKATFEDEIKQSSDEMRNLPPIQQIPQGATTEQIEDIQQQNALALAGLREDIQRGRVEDIQSLFSIPQRFRSQQEAGAGIFDPFERQSSSIDVQSGDFEKSTSEGAPIASPMLPESTFAQSEEEKEMGLMAGEDVAAVERLQPRESIKTGGGSAVSEIKSSEIPQSVTSLTSALKELKMEKKPIEKASAEVWIKYANDLSVALGERVDPKLTKRQAQKKVKDLLKKAELDYTIRVYGSE